MEDNIIIEEEEKKAADTEKKDENKIGIIPQIVGLLFLLGVFAMPFHAWTQKNLTKSMECVDILEKNMYWIEASGYQYAYGKDIDDEDQMEENYEYVEDKLTEAASTYDEFLLEYHSLSKKKTQKLYDYIEETYDTNYDSMIEKIKSFKIDKTEYGEDKDNTYVMETVLNDIALRREELIQWHKDIKDTGDAVLFEGYVSNNTGLLFFEPVLDIELYDYNDNLVNTRTEELMSEDEIWDKNNDASFHIWVDKSQDWNYYKLHISYRVKFNVEEV